MVHGPQMKLLAQWIATGGWHSRVVRLWRAQDGKLIHEWIDGGPALVVFTPDARMFYKLEELWGDVPSIEVEAAAV